MVASIYVIGGIQQGLGTPAKPYTTIVSRISAHGCLSTICKLHQQVNTIKLPALRYLGICNVLYIYMECPGHLYL